MSTSTIAGLRIPLSLVFGVFITASTFWALWSVTTTTFTYDGIQAVPLDFGPQVRETAPIPKVRRIKVELEEPIDINTVVDRNRVVELLPPVVVDDRVSRDSPLLPSLEGVGQRAVRSTYMGGTDSEANPIVRIEPTYPPSAINKEQEGWVQVQFNVSAAGAVTDVVVVDSEPPSVFDSAARIAVGRWRYRPSVVGGTAVERVGMQTILRFTLEDE